MFKIEIDKSFKLAYFAFYGLLCFSSSLLFIFFDMFFFVYLYLFMGFVLFVAGFFKIVKNDLDKKDLESEL